MRDEIYLRKLGQRIEMIRKKEEITQELLAKSCGFNRGTIIRIEKGEVNSTINVLRCLAKSLKIDLLELLSI